MSIEVEKLRANTLSNNLLWLESFGCIVRRLGAAVYVDHPELPEYCARLILGPPEEALEQLHLFLNEADTARLAPDIYVDEVAGSGAFHSTLVGRGFKVRAVNATKAGLWTPMTKASNFGLQRARPNDYGRWSALYSEGFMRSGRDAEIDLSRWEKAFRSSSVRHWFVMKGSKIAGVCQTCVGSGVTGVYSFTLSSLERGLTNFRPAIRALRMRLTATGPTHIYFERLWNTGKPNRQRIAGAPHGFAVIRTMIGYRLSK